jgi:hypothetical protein
MIGHIPDVGHGLTAGSFAGGTSGLARFYHIFPSRTLGAFVPTNSPCFRTVCEHPIAGAFGQSEITPDFTHCSIRQKGSIRPVITVELSF